MKIAAIALASTLTAIAYSVQPGFGQTTSQDSDQSQYGQDQNRTQLDQTGSRLNEAQPNMNRPMDDEDDEGAVTIGQNPENPQANQNGSNWSGSRRQGRMGPHWHEHMGRNEGASFSFRNGPARMAVHCPANEPLQTCVNAATQLLDKIGSLKNAGNLGNGQTNGQGMSGSTGTVPSEGASDESVPARQPGSNLPAGGNDADQSDRTDQQ